MRNRCSGDIIKEFINRKEPPSPKSSPSMGEDDSESAPPLRGGDEGEGDANGFTLIEILVSIAILSIIIAALYSTFFLSQKAVASVDDSLIKLQECRNAVDAIKREIESSVFSQDRPYSMFKVVDRDFYGRQTSRLSFTAFSTAAPALSAISYTVEEENGRLVLRKKISSAYSEPSGDKGIDLMEDIESFTIETRYNDRWVRTWDSALSKSIPAEVRIHVTILVRNGQEKLQMYDVARPRIGRTI